MEVDRSFRILIFKCINIFFIILGITISIVIGSKATGLVYSDVFFISPTNPKERLYFSTDDIEILSETYPEKLFTYEAFDDSFVEVDGIMAYSKIIYTNSDFSSINYIDFTCGSFWSENSEYNDVIVLSESLAWKLFGNTKDIAGAEVTLNNAVYTVNGVVKQSQINESNYNAWLPYKYSYNNLLTSSKIENIYFKDMNYSKINSYVDAKKMLEILIKNQMEFSIVDINEYKTSFKTRYEIVLLGVSLYIIAVVIIKLTTLSKLLLTQNKNLLLILTQFLLYFGIIFILIKHVKIDMWVSSFENGFWIQFVNALTNIWIISPKANLSYNLLSLVTYNTYANVIFIAMFICMFNFMFVHDIMGLSKNLWLTEKRTQNPCGRKKDEKN